MGNINCIKTILAASEKTNKLLVEQLGKNPVTVIRWCSNTTQPYLHTLSKMSDLLDVNIRELLVNRIVKTNI